MKEETLNKYIGKTKGVLTVLGLDHETYDPIKQIKRSYFKCKCNRCGQITIVRADRFGRNETYKPVCCSHCVISKQKETAEQKYKIKETKSYRDKINSIKGNAKARKLKMELTDLELMQLLKQPCYYCRCNNAMGIDRINSNDNYTKTNCVPCCKICNIMKNKFPIQLFLDKINKIYYNFHNEGSTTISKESTSEANADGSEEHLN